MEQQKLKVAIVDDHWSVRVGTLPALVAMEPRLEAGAKAETVAELLELEASDRSHVVLLDVELRNQTTPAQNVAALIAAGYTVVLFTGESQPHRLARALGTGAAGIVSKTDDPQDLIDVILNLGDLDDSKNVSPLMVKIVLACDAMPTLSGKRLEALQYLAEGATAEQVAKLMFVSVNTVNKHIGAVRAAYEGAGAKTETRIDLYKAAVRFGHVRDDPAE